MSATLPKIGKLRIPLKERTGFCGFVASGKILYAESNFAGRVEFRFELFQEEIDMNDLADFVLGKSVEYRDKPGKNGTVHTIIEFITKNLPRNFMLSYKKRSPFDEVFLLSGTILEPGGGKLSMS